MHHMDLSQYMELLERKPNADTDVTPLVDLELTAKRLHRLPYEEDPDLATPDEAWYVQALWREGNELRVLAHAFSFHSAATAERFLAKLRESRIVTIQHVTRSPFWGPDPSFGFKPVAVRRLRRSAARN